MTETSAPRAPGFGAEGQASALPAVPPDCPPELLERMGADVLAKLERRWSRKHHALGPCLVCRDDVPRGPDAVKGPYGRMYDPALGKTDYIHLIMWRRCYPDRPIPKGWTVDHLCEVSLCGRPDHLDPRPVTHAENTRRRHQRARTASETVREPKAAQSFAVTLFAGIDRPTVQPRTVSLDELAELLGRFEILEDKRRGRCWSPTAYANGATSRGNAGVKSVSCLVFDLDRVPPDPKRLEHVCWIGHTTWSHTLLAQRWRVAVPLVKPVSAKRWAEVWHRARAALCPEADPACKDPSRAYWLPSHRAGAVCDIQRHDGPLLDMRTLPELPAEQRTVARPRTRKLSQHADQAIRRRAEAYMVEVLENLASAAPGGRNAALNRAAWTLGRWIAARALAQADVEDTLYAAAERNGLVADDGQRQTWATIRSGMGAGLKQPIELDAAR